MTRRILERIDPNILVQRMLAHTTFMMNTGDRLTDVCTMRNSPASINGQPRTEMIPWLTYLGVRQPRRRLSPLHFQTMRSVSQPVFDPIDRTSDRLLRQAANPRRRQTDRHIGEKPLTLASGKIAMKLNENRKAASQCKWWDRKLNGTKMSKTLNQLPNRK
jgi:hypothetical protein